MVKLRQKLSGPKLMIVLMALGLFLRLVLSVQIYSGDVNNHIAWGKDSLELGYKGIYEREFFSRYGTLPPTYPPIPIFLFKIFYGLYVWTYKTAWSLNLSYRAFPSKLIPFLEDQDTLPAFTKMPAIFADLGIAYLIYLYTKRLIKQKNSKWPLIATSFILFNPSFFYNSALWGQIEAVPLVFVLASFYLLFFSKRCKTSATLFTLALLTKQTSIVFIPLYIFIFLLKFGLENSIKGLLVSLSIFWLAFLPFFKSGNFLSFPLLTYWEKIQTGSGSDFITDHAFNFWALITGLGKIPDSKLLVGIPFKWWGYGIFILLVLIILLRLNIKRLSVSEMIWAAALIPFAAFLFLTRMHERYLEQALPFLLLTGVKEKKLLKIYILVSLLHFANLYHNWWAPRIDFFVNLLSSKIVIDGLIITTIGVFFFFLLKYIKGIYSK